MGTFFSTLAPRIPQWQEGWDACRFAFGVSAFGTPRFPHSGSRIVAAVSAERGPLTALRPPLVECPELRVGFRDAPSSS